MGIFSKPEPEGATVNGTDLHCIICRNDKFLRRNAQLHTAFASFFDLEWTGKTADCLVCSNCGYIHWFADL